MLNSGNTERLVIGVAIVVVLAVVAMVASRLRGGDGKSRGSCLGCVFLLVFGAAVAGMIVRAVKSAEWSRLASQLEVSAAEGVEIFDADRVVGSGTVELIYAPPTFSAGATPESIAATLFPGSEVVEMKSQGVTTAEAPEGHWVGTAYGVVLRAPDRSLDSVVLFLKSLAEDPRVGIRAAVVRARRGSDRFVATETVGIEVFSSTYLERLFRLDRPPRLTLEVRAEPTPARWLDEGEEPAYRIDTLPEKE